MIAKWPTHRLIKSDEISEKNVIAKVKAKMRTADAEDIDDMKSKLGDWQMGLVFRSGKCMLASSEATDDPMWNLDTYVAQEIIMKGIYKSDEDKATVSYDAEFPSVKKKMADKE